MDKGVVERSVNVRDAKDIFSLSDLRAKLNGSFFLGGLGFLWRLFMSSKQT
jgi:hypothetical protein